MRSLIHLHRAAGFLAVAILLVALAPYAAFSQGAEIRATGILGDKDSKGRHPDLGVRVIRNGETVSIVADAHIPNREFKDFPVQFDFYVNRRLFSQQIRNEELPGPVGIDVGTDIATVPFSYTVVAKLLLANGRHPTTMINGTVFASDLVASLDCTLLLEANDAENSIEVVENNVATNQLGNQTFELSIDQKSVDEENDVVANISIGVASDGTASGSVSFTINEESSSARTVSVSGTAEFDDGDVLSAINVSSETGDTTLRCS